MATLMLDTHVVAWLYAGKIEKVPAAAQRRLESDTLLVSPMVGLELEYLHEIGRLRERSQVVVADLRQRLGLRVAEAPFVLVASAAAELSWTRDPFDRLIAAHALACETSLLTADTTMHKHLALAVWG